MTTRAPENYSIVLEPEFVETIAKHYHGDYGMLFSTSADDGRTIWQCACGYRAITSGVINIILKEAIDSYLQSKPIKCKDSPNRNHSWLIEDYEDSGGWDMYCQWCYNYKNWKEDDDSIED